MKTGELADRAGVNVQTIRFYEREHLLREPSRKPSGYRVYTEQDVRHIQFIRDCQDLGFTLKEIKQLVDLHGFFCASPQQNPLGDEQGFRMMEIVKERLASIDHKIQALSRMRDRLLAAMTESQSRHIPVCPAQHLK